MTRSLSFPTLRKAALIGAATLLAACAGVTNGLPREGAPVIHRGFDGFVMPVDGPVQLEVTLSEDMMARVDGPGPYGSGARGLRSAFASGGYLGEKDLDFLVEKTRGDLVEDLAKRGVTIDEESDTVLRVTLVDAKPNRPTFSQLSKDISLSSRSQAEGGISVEGELVSVSTGESRGEFTYGWYDDLTSPATSTWSDARRAIGMMSKRVAKQLTPLSDKNL